MTPTPKDRQTNEEAWAAVFANIRRGGHWVSPYIAAAIGEAVAAERERCAAVAEHVWEQIQGRPESHDYDAGGCIARAIRSGEVPQ